MNTDQSLVSIAPGRILKHELEARGWSQTDLAEILGRPVQAVNEILNGKKAITAATARGLEGALGTKAQFWLDLETQYRLSLEAEADDEVARRSRLFSRTPVADLRRRKWIVDSKDTHALEADVVRFLRLRSIDEEPSIRFAARKGTNYGTVEPQQEAWCCRARELADSLGDVKRFTQQKFENGLEGIRDLALSENGVKEIPNALADLGVRFVVVEHLPRTKIDGATFWLSKSRPVVAMSLRYGRIDYFWFTLFHELSHVRHGDAFSFDTDILGETVVDIETRANREAAATLVPQAKLRNFVSRSGKISKKSIIEFAKTIAVHPGIVLGQLQHREHVKWSTARELLVSVRDKVASVSATDGWGQ